MLGLSSEATVAEVRGSVIKQACNTEEFHDQQTWIFSEAGLGKGLRRCFYSLNGTFVKNALNICSKENCTNIR